MAVSSASEQFEPQKGTHRLCGRDHLCPREPRLFEQPLQGNLSQIRNKQVEPSELSPESPDREIQPVHVGNLSDLGPRPWEPFLVSPSGEPGKPFFFENQRDGHGTQPVPAFRKNAADIIDGEILFSQSDDRIPGPIGFGRRLGSFLGGQEERAPRVLTELMREDPEASGGIGEAAGDFGRRELIDEVGPEGFVLAVGRVLGFQKEVSHRC
jgi:hypothetical protein